MSPTKHAVLAAGLRKRYGDNEALRGLDLSVPEGSVHGLLGPNGAGKTTFVRILATLLRLDGGRAEVAGFDVARRPAQVRYRIGLLGQHAAVDEILSGRQNLEMFGRLYHLSRRGARRRADELLAWFGLPGDRPIKQYSGGMRRRLDLAASLILAPAVLFLDEPTTGLDPRARMEVWEAIRSLAGAGTTVLLTTQYLDEADRLADQVSVIDEGRIVAEGSPDRLKAEIGGDRIDVVLGDGKGLAEAAARIARATGVRPADVDVDRAGRRVSAPLRERVTALTEVVRALDGAADLPVEDIVLRQPTLDDVFLHFTGRPAAVRDQDESDPADAGDAGAERETVV